MTDHSSKSTVFGAFLYEYRILSGCVKISDFLSDKKIPFTDNYYRDVEAGRKKLSIDAMLQLYTCLGLPENRTFDYFWHYFKDILPDEIHAMLFGKRVHSATASLSELNKVREYDAALLRKAVAISRYEAEYVADNSIVELFEQRFPLLPLMHYLYMVESASEHELSHICEQLGLRFDDDAHAFMTKIGTSWVKDGVRRYARFMPTLRMPRNDRGLHFKNHFVRHETERSLHKPDASEFFPPGATFKYSSMTAIRKSALGALQNRIVDLLSELEVESKANVQLEDPTALPYFVSLMISGRPEYDGRPAREDPPARRKRSTPAK